MKSLKPLKPYMLKRWRMGVSPNAQYFFTCARPGRTGDPATKDGQVQDDLVHRWVLGLPCPNTAILSLLGRKPDGLSETLSTPSTEALIQHQSAESVPHSKNGSIIGIRTDRSSCANTRRTIFDL
jgi:hypothetical protein